MKTDSSTNHAEDERRLIELCELSAGDALTRLGSSLQGLSAEEVERRQAEYGPNELARGKHLGLLGRHLPPVQEPAGGPAAGHRAGLRHHRGIQVDRDRRGDGRPQRRALLHPGSPVGARRWSPSASGCSRAPSCSGTAGSRRSGSRRSSPATSWCCTPDPSSPPTSACSRSRTSSSASRRSPGSRWRSRSRPTPDPLPRTRPGDLPNACFLGSNVTSGAARGLVVNTGTRTLFGAIAERLTERREETSFDRGVRSFTWLMIRFMLVMVFAVFLIVGPDQGELDRGAPLRALHRRRPHPRDAADDRHREPGQGRADHGREEGHRQAAPLHPEPRRDRHPLHRQDRDPDPGRGGARAARRDHRRRERGRPELRLPQQLLPDGAAQSHRPGHHRARGPRRGAELPAGGRAAVRLSAPPDVGRGGLRGRPRPGLQGRGGGDLQLLHPVPGGRRGLHAARHDARGSLRGGGAPQQRRLPGPGHRLPGVPPGKDLLHHRRRERAGAAGLHRLLRSAQGLGREGARPCSSRPGSG